MKMPGLQHPALSAWLAMLVVLAVLAALWTLAAHGLGLSALPDPWAAVQALPALVLDPSALWAVAQSLARMFAAYLWALACAVPLGLYMARSRLVHDMFHPLMTLAYPMPKAALMPVLMLWFGLGSFAKILVIALGVSLPVLYHSYQGARRVEEKLLWAARAMGMKPAALVFKVVLPAALPDILIGCRVGIVMALIVMVSSEMIARQEGVGNLLFTAMDMAQYATVYAVILLLAALGCVLDAGFAALRRRLIHWSDALGDTALE